MPRWAESLTGLQPPGQAPRLDGSSGSSSGDTERAISAPPNLSLVTGAAAVGIVGPLAIAAATFLKIRLIHTRWSGPGRRPDGSWQEGRRVRDMTPVGKVALMVTVGAFVGTVVLRAVAGSSAWFWVTCLLGLFAAVVAGISERRRLRRLGVSAGGGPTQTGDPR